MKFTCATEINSPIKKVAELFADENNLKEWQEGFVRLEHISGVPGQVGAKSAIRYNTGRHSIDLTETIMANNLPQEFTALYEHTHMTNTMRSGFISVNENLTRMECEIEYLKFNGVVPKLMAFVMPGVFKRQTQKWLDNFKSFVERK